MEIRTQLPVEQKCHVGDLKKGEACYTSDCIWVNIDGVNVLIVLRYSGCEPKVHPIHSFGKGECNRVPKGTILTITL